MTVIVGLHVKIWIIGPFMKNDMRNDKYARANSSACFQFVKSAILRRKRIPGNFDYFYMGNTNSSSI